MKSCTLSGGGALLRIVARTGFLPVLAVLAFAALLAFPQIASAQYTFDNATTSAGIAGNLGSLIASGSRSTPALVDLNGDGKLDIVTGNASGTFQYFINTGTAKSTPATPGTMSWAAAPSNPFASLSTASTGGSSSPTFVDIDGDTDLDMFSGDGWGRIHYYKQTGIGTNVFVEQFDGNNPFYYEDLPNVGVYVPVSVPGGSTTIGFLDGNGDGIKDAVLGNAQGQFFYAENYGTEYAPVFVKVPLAGAVIGTSAPYEIDGPRNAASQRAPQVLQNLGTNTNFSSTVCTVDMNCDGILDVLSGNRAGTFQFRQLNPASIANRFTSVAGSAAPLDGKDVNTLASTSDYSYPAAGDLDGDGDVDFISGMSTGRFRYFRNTTCNTAPTFSPNVCGTSQPPVILDLNGNTEHTLTAVDLGGPVATSNCFVGASMVFTPDLVTCANVGTPVVVTLQARDNTTGVKSSPTGCTVTLTVQDNTPPVAICKPFYDIEVGDGNKTLGTIPVSAVEDGSTDNCTSNAALIKTVTYNYSTTIPLDCSNVGTTVYEIYLTVKDASNNSDLTSLPGPTGVSRCTTVVRVVDTKGPVVDVATLPALTREQCNYNAGSDVFLAGFEIPLPTATDRCTPLGSQGAAFVKVNGGAEIPASFGMVWTPYPDFTVGAYTLTWIYQDGQIPANRTTQTQTLTITSPKLQFPNCPTQDVVLDPASPPTTCAGRTAPQGITPGSEVDWINLNLTTNITLCGGVPTSPVTISKTHTASSVFPYGTTTVYYSAQDGAGNVGNCSFKVVVRDPISQLTVTFPTNFVNTTVSPSVNISNSAFLCTNYTSAAPLFPGCLGISVPDDGGTDCGRIVSWTGIPTVTNAQHPCAGPYPVRIEIAVGSPNGVPGTVVTSGSFFSVGYTLLNFVTTDSKGNTYILADFWVEVQNVAPVITCSQPTITVTAPADQCYANVTVPAATAIDNCSGVIITDNYFGTNGGSGTFYPSYLPDYVNTPTPIVFTATDVNGLQSQCTVNVYVKNTQKPTFLNCPLSKTITVDVTPGCGEYYNAVGGLWFDPYGTGNCGINLDSVSIVVTHPDFAPVVLDDGKDDATSTGTDYSINGGGFDRTPEHLFNEGTSTVLYTATDFAGNTGTCSFTVTVSDNVAPNVFCPLQPVVRSTVANCLDTLELGLYDDGLNAIDIAPAVGICGTPSSIAYRLPSSLVNLPASHTFPVGMHNLVVVVTDRSGNSSSCPFQIDVKDLNPPVHTNCPANITVNDTDGGCGQVVTWTGPAFSDDCTAANALTIVRTPNMPSGSFFPIGTTTISIVARDASLNQSAACFFDVIVNDKTKPVITCPANILKQITNTDPANCYAYVDFTVTATDDCTNIGSGYVNLYGFSPTPGPGGDFEPAGLDADFIAEAEITGHFVAVNTPQTLYYRADDASGNSATCSFTITVEDKQGPVISGCPGNQTTSTVSCAGTPIGWTPPSVSGDNCGTGSMGAPNRTPGSVFTPGTTVVSYVATDNLGNTRSCTFSITVTEGTLPTFTPLVSNANQPPCLGYAVKIAADDCLGNGTLSLLSQLTAPAATDNCAPTTVVPTLMSNVAPYNTALTFPQSVTSGGFLVVWKATDASGNTATCLQTIYAQDKTAPVPTCPPFTYTLLSGQTQFDVCANFMTVRANNTALDNCDGAMPNINSQFQYALQQCQFAVGTHPFYWNVTDVAGNTATCTQMITVVGSGPCIPASSTFSVGSSCGSPTAFVLPTANCPANVTVTAAQLGIAATDNCGNPLTLANQTASFSATGNQTVTFTSPVGGATCSRVVSMTCNTCTPSTATFAVGSNCGSPTAFVLPNANCPANVTVTAAELGISATDNCGNVLTLTNQVAAFSATGNQTVTFTSPVGSATCSRVVNVTCNSGGCVTPPTFGSSCPANITMNIVGNGCTLPVPWTVPTATNPCGGGVTTTRTAGPAPGSSFSAASAATTITYTSVSNANASLTATCSFTVQVLDNVAPTITCPPDVTVISDLGNANCMASTAPLGTPTATDNCGTPTVTNDAPSPVDGYIPGENFVFWTAIDASSNASDCQQIVFVETRQEICNNLDDDCDGMIDEDVAGGLSELVKKLAGDGASGDTYGHSVGISGNYAIVGAPLDDDKGSSSGAAYVLFFDGSTWTQQKKIVPTDGAAGDLFGESVAIDGDLAIVGAREDDDRGTNSGSAYIFGRNVGGTNNWGLVKKLIASVDGAAYDRFGWSVDIHGGVAAVGAPQDDNGATGNQGSVYIFAQNTGGLNNWGQLQKRLAVDGTFFDEFGTSVSLGISGVRTHLIVGAPKRDEAGTNSNSGAAYIFRDNQGGTDNWGQVKKILPLDRQIDDNFGFSVAISGEHAVVGANLEDNSGLTNNGSAYVFAQNFGGADNWGERAKLMASDAQDSDNLGWSVAIDGTEALIGARNDDEGGVDGGSAYFFSQNEGGADLWGEVGKVVASDGSTNDNFGTSVGISGGNSVIGAFRDDITVQTDRGSAYFFVNGCGSNFNGNSVDRKDEQANILSGASSVRLFPNPTSDLLNIDVVLETESEVTITVTDAAGRIVSQVFSGVSAPEARYSWDASTVPSGLYFVRVDGGSLRKVVPVSVVK